MARSKTAAAAARKLTSAAPVFAALGDETRLRLVVQLAANGPQSIVQLTGVADVSRQAITKHLHALEGVGLVHSRREGRERRWTIRPRRIEEVRGYLDLISQQWDEALERLRSFVEDD